MIRPIVGPHGVGFFSMEQLPQFQAEYNEKNVGRYWNYTVTPDNYEWPEPLSYMVPEHQYVIDGFAPNLNKTLHIGHLRQLALAKSLWSMLGNKTRFVALLGASQGVYSYATQQLQEWFEFVDYKPELFYDVLMPRDAVPRHKIDDPGDELNGAEVWDGDSKVVVVRSDGRPTYAFADIAFAATVKPTHYITGVEQKEHFMSLGLRDKHLGMGLVLGEDGKKLKSRDGSEDAKAQAVIEEVMANLDDSCPDKKKLAWNILAWNFLTVARGQNVKYNVKDWTNPDSAGLYITYTYARVKKALKPINWLHIPLSSLKEIAQKTAEDCPGMTIDESLYELSQGDAELAGFADYYKYHLKRSVETLDPTHMATFAHDLARRLGKAYHAEKIQGGRYGFQFATNYANSVLGNCMKYLGMFQLEQV